MINVEDLVSVIIPSFKRKKRLYRALKSVLNQTYSNLEIIIIDDNIESQYSKYIYKLLNKINDNRIIYYKNKNNIGPAKSKNKGLRKANGKLVAFLDDDDVLTPKSIELKVNRIKKSKFKNIGLVYGWAESRFEDNTYINEYKYKYNGNCLDSALYQCIAATSQWLCFKDVVEKIGGFSNIVANEDWEFIFKLIGNGYSIDYVPYITNIYYEHLGDERMSVGNIRNLKGMMELRDHARLFYNKVSCSDSKKIELNFSSQICDFAFKNHKYKIGLQELLFLFKNSPYKFTRKIIRIILRKYN